MALRIPYGVDPDETWEVDYVQESARRLIRANRAAAAVAREEAQRIDPDRLPEGERQAARERVERVLAAAAACDAQAAKLEADLAGYTPGSGPVFVVGPLPNGKRGEIRGEGLEVARLGEGKDANARDERWAEEVVRWSVRGHRGLKSRRGAELPFVPETITWAGEPRQVVSRKTLEAYGASRVLSELALLVLDSQRLEEAGKNA